MDIIIIIVWRFCNKTWNNNKNTEHGHCSVRLHYINNISQYFKWLPHKR